MEMNGTDTVEHVYVSLQHTTTTEESSPLLQNGGDSGSPLIAKIKTYPWRWVVLAVFTLNNAFTNYVWIMSAVIADLMSCYYGVPQIWVNFLSTSFLMSYVVLVWPGVWILDRFGLRLPVVVSSGLLALGATIRVIGTGSQNFWIVLLGQFIASTCNVVFFGAGPLLSETWFPSNERATATAIVSGISPQLGILIAMGLTPMVVHSPLTQQVCNASITTSPALRGVWEGVIYHRWLYYQSGVAAVGIVTFLLTVCVFYDAPPTPPSLSRKLESSRHDDRMDKNRSSCHSLTSYFSTLLLFMKNFYFMIFLITSSIMVASSGSVVAIVNEIVNPFFPDYEEQIGYLGVASLVASIFSMLLVGRILDRIKQYYVMNIVLSFAGTASVTSLVVLILYQHNFYLLYLAMVCNGVTLTAYLALAYEYAVEMTYPLPEATSAGLINVMSQVIAIVMILLVTPERTVFAMWFLVGTTAFGALLAVFTKPKLKRVEIDKKMT